MGNANYTMGNVFDEGAEGVLYANVEDNNQRYANMSIMDKAHVAAAAQQNMYTGHGLSKAQADYLIDTNQWIDESMRNKLMSGDHYMVGPEGSDPYNQYSDPYYHNGNKNKEEEESGVESVALSAGTGFNPDGWQITPAPYVPYTPPAAQDWSAWMFGSPFGGQGGLAYQPGSQEYLEQYIPQNVWGSAPGLSEGVMAELAPSTGGLLEV